MCSSSHVSLVLLLLSRSSITIGQLHSSNTFRQYVHDHISITNPNSVFGCATQSHTIMLCDHMLFVCRSICLAAGACVVLRVALESYVDTCDV